MDSSREQATSAQKAAFISTYRPSLTREIARADGFERNTLPKSSSLTRNFRSFVFSLSISTTIALLTSVKITST